MNKFKRPEKRLNCIQCGNEMKDCYGSNSAYFPFCENPECPNYGVLQVGIIFNKK